MDEAPSTHSLEPVPRIDMARNEKSGWQLFVPSLTSILLIIFFVISLLMNGAFKPLIRRGFFCNDSSINYPIKPDTVSFKVLMVIALLIPGLVINICDRKLSKLLDDPSIVLKRKPYGIRKRKKSESMHDEISCVEDEELLSPLDPVKRRLVVNEDDSDLENASCSDAKLSSNSDDEKEVNLFLRLPQNGQTAAVNGDASELKDPLSGHLTIQRVPHLRKSNYSDLQLFLFGFCATSFLTGIGKTTSGRFRPHFKERCQPNVDCSSPENINRYIEVFECTTNLSDRHFSYISTSWPSGHASIIFFSMIYLAVYLQIVIPVIVRLSSSKVQSRFNPLALFISYVLMLGMAGFIALTRVSDYHHHPTDVLSGTVIGSLIALVMARFLLGHVHRDLPFVERLN